MRKRYLECGKIVSTHGVRGEVKVQPWCDSPEFLLDFGTLYFSGGREPVRVERARAHKGMVILKLAGIGSMDEAAALRGKTLYLDREDAPDDGGCYVQDLLGMRVLDADTGRCWGILHDILFTGANDVYEIVDAAGTRRLVPAIPDVVLGIDADAGEMRIRPLKGLFDNAD